MSFAKLKTINVNAHVEKKDSLSYLSWAWAWDEFKTAMPDATYEIVKAPNGLPYFESDAGAVVYTKVTAGGETHEMWLPVMDHKNRAMKTVPYTIETAKGAIKVQAYTMFDVNKTLMRCLVKNLAMFGLGLYIYAGEDLPEPSDEVVVNARQEDILQKLRDASLLGLAALKAAQKPYIDAQDQDYKAVWLAHGSSIKQAASLIKDAA